MNIAVFRTKSPARALSLFLLALLAPLTAPGQSAGDGREFLFPLIADDGGRQSRLHLFLTDLSGGANRCTLEIRGPGMDGGMFDAHPAVSWAGAVAAVELGGIGRLALRSGPEHALSFGYTKLVCDAPASARMLLGWSEAGTTVSMTALENAPEGWAHQLPVLPRLGRQGLILTNAAAAAASCSIELVDDRDAGIGSARVTVPARASGRHFIEDLIPLPLGFDSGSAMLACDREVAALWMPARGPVFAAAPAIALDDGAAAGNRHVLPLIADGGGFQSQLLVTNLAAGANECILSLRGAGLAGDSFRPAAGVAVAGAGASWTLDGVGDQLSLLSAGGPDLRFGYGALECKAPVAARSLLSTGPETVPAGVTVVPASPPAQWFVLHAAPPDGDMALVFNNDSDAADSCSIELNDYEDLHLGIREFAVPARSTAVRFFSDLFDAAEGALTVLCEGNSHALSLPLSGAAFAALPPAVHAALPPEPDPGETPPPMPPTEPTGSDSAPFLGYLLPFERRYPLDRPIPALELPRAQGGDAPLSYALEPAVPGLRFDPDGNRLTGAPTKEGSYAMSYSVADADGDKDFYFFDIRVYGPDTTPVFSASDAPADRTFEAGSPIAPLQLPAAAGGNEPVVYSLAPRVPGLRFDPSTRTLTGVPFRFGDYRLTYKAEDHESDAATLGFSVTVVARVSPEELLDAGGCSDGAFIDSASATPELVDDCRVLVDFVNSLIRQGFLRGKNVLREWGRGAQRKMEDWDGVVIEDGRVTRLDLWARDLAGKLPAELGRLDALSTLNLQRNRFSGPIPPELGNLANLRFLYLNDNRLEGTIPRELGELDDLRMLEIGNNRLTGEVPVWLGDLEELFSLHLGGNELTGPIPRSLGRLSRMAYLRLDGNDLSGPIPDELRQFKQLVTLYLGSNRLTGELPVWLGEFPQLSILDLSANEFDGPIPRELGKLNGLIDLRLHENRLTGPIPLELAGLANLENLDLALNRLTGPLPAEFAALPKLRTMELLGNRLRGTVPWEFRDRVDVGGMRLSLDGNLLEGYGPPPRRPENPSYSTDAASNGNASHHSIAYFQGPLVMEWDWQDSRVERHTPILGRWAALAVSVDHAVETPPPVATRVLDADGNVLANSLDEAGEASTARTGEGRWRTEYVFHLPGALHQEGNRIVHVIDPDDELAETDESDNVSPPVVLYGEKPPKFRITFVPLRYTGEEAAWTGDDLDLLMRGALALLPLADDYEARVDNRPIDIPPENRDGRGLNLLAERWNLEADPDEFYHGVADQMSRGVALLGGRVAVSPTSIHETIPHELGHNLGLSHTPGCGAQGPDYDYPHDFGRLGPGRGWDLNFRRFVTEKRVSSWEEGLFVADIMSYCGEEKLISDYNYEILTEYWLSRRADTAPATVSAAAVATASDSDAAPFAPASESVRAGGGSLALAGTIGADGGPTLTQARYSAKAPRPPPRASEYTLALFDSAGVQLYAEPLLVLFPKEGEVRFWAARTPPPLRAAREIVVLDALGEEILRQSMPELSAPRGDRVATAAAESTTVGAASAAGGAGPAPPANTVTAASLAVGATLGGENCSNGTFVDDPGVNAGLVRDCEALVDFADSLIREGRLAADNVLFQWGREGQRKLNDWEGVTTSGGRVTHLQLYRKEIRGTLPAALGRLSALTSLNLLWNEFSGTLPPELSQLRNLEKLILSGNDLSGPLPRWIGHLRKLDTLLLRGNGFSGPIPREVARLRGLQILTVDRNRLTGEIPAVIGELRNLEWLSLGFNDLSGTVPEELGNLSGLGILELDYNRLTGSLPWEYHELFREGVYLQSLRFSGNAIDGFAPPPPGAADAPRSAGVAASGNASHHSIEYYQGPLLLEWDYRGRPVERRTPILGRWAALAACVDHDFETPPRVITRVLDSSGETLAPSLAEAATPTTLRTADGRWRSEYVFHLPGELFREGNRVVHVIDPDNALAETDESDNVSKPVALSGQTPPDLLVTFVPVQFGEDDPWWQDVDPELLVSGISAYLPVADDIEARIGPVMKTEQRYVGPAYEELVELWNFEAAPNEFYHGIHDRDSIGLANTEFEVAISPLSPVGVIPHEYGHNLSLLHPPGCQAAHNDFDYPHADGKLGQRRVWDARMRRFVSGADGNYADLMSYCGDFNAVSEYSYDKATEYWLSWKPADGGGSASAAPAISVESEVLGPESPAGPGSDAESRRNLSPSAAVGDSIALAGKVDADGVWSLSQARLSRQPPRPPRGGGEYTLLLFDAAGVQIYAEPLIAGEIPEADGLIWAARVPPPLRAARELVVLDARGERLLRETLPAALD